MKVKYDDSDIDDMIKDVANLKSSYNQIANDVVNFYIDSFNDQGFTDYSFQPWQKSLKDNGATLVLTGNLRNSIHTLTVNENGFTIISDTDYSAIHNEGGTLPITPKMRKFFLAMGIENKNNPRTAKMWFGLAHSKQSSITIPKRTFMDKSEVLNDNIVHFIIEKIT